MSETAESALVPEPGSVVELIERIAASQWPDGDADQNSYFHQLGFDKTDGQNGVDLGHSYPTDPNRPGILVGELARTNLAITNASWTSYRGELFSINLFLYPSSASSDHNAVRGFQRIHSQLLAIYGPPTDATSRPFDEATAFWEVNGTSIEMYCYTRAAPGLQLGLSHVLRNAAYEAASAK
jgi:hypothetical protein